MYTWQSLIEVGYVYMYECVHVGATLSCSFLSTLCIWRYVVPSLAVDIARY